MPNWGSANKSQQEDDASSAPQSAATGPTQACVCPRPTPPVNPPPQPVEPPKPVDPKQPTPVITRIEWLDGKDDEVLSGEGLHFVNLPPDAKWVGGKRAKNKRRLGHEPGYKVWFDQPGSHHFKVKLKPAGGNAHYTNEEVGRGNPRFKARVTWSSFTTDGDGTKVVKIGPDLTVAGGDKYSLEAHDDQAVIVNSGSIKTIRAVHVVQIKMTGLATVAPSISDCIGEYAKHHLRVVDLPSVNIAHQPNIGSDAESATLKTNANAAWAGSHGKAKEPYALGIVFTDHLAVKNSNKTLTYRNRTVGPGTGPQNLRIMGAGLTDPTVNEHPLWRDIVPGESWFIAASYTPDGGTAVALTEAQCVPSSATGYSARVNVTTSGLPAGTGTIRLTVNWVDRMRGGLSFTGTSLVAICTRAWWTDISAAEQNQTLTHELGHQFGMVPEGLTAEALDAHADQYTASGHVGSHCHHGVAAKANYGDDASNTASDCVIFGATNGKLAFCPLCGPQVRKVDLTKGW